MDVFIKLVSLNVLTDEIRAMNDIIMLNSMINKNLVTFSNKYYYTLSIPHILASTVQRYRQTLEAIKNR